MKKILFILVLIISFKLSAQNRELVEYAEKSAYENKSYIYTKRVKLSSPSGGGSFRIKAAEHGKFFAKPAEGSRIRQNIPPSSNKNFTRTENILVRDIVNQGQIIYLEPSQIAIGYQYIDGLGRPLQDIAQGSSPSGKDLVKYFTYDNAGRSPYDYLPYVAGSANGQFQANYLSDQSAFYGPSGIINDSRPFTENELENSPLSRTLRSFSPGNDWKTNNRGISASSKIDVSANILFWRYHEASGIPSLVTYDNPTGRYPAGVLAYSETTDEENRVTKNYTDFLNRKVLEEVQGADGSWLQTYYVYDDQARLRIVFPPEASASISQYLGLQTDAERQTFLDRWAFQFTYDKYGRVSKKKVPGIGWYLYVHDKWDRLVLSQDPKQTVANQWSFIKYDRFNRPVVTGIYTTSAAHGTLQTNAMNVPDASRFETLVENDARYTLGNSFPFSGINEGNVNVIHFFDNYDFVLAGWDDENNDYSYRNVPGYPQASEKLGAVKGYQTGSKVRVLGNDKWLNSVIYYYDDYYVAQSIDETDIGGIVVTTNKFDFAGRLEKEHHLNSYSSLFEEYTYDYDKAGRVLKIRHSINGATPVILVSNKYNELGQLVEKNLHSDNGGSSYLQSADYQYNIRGWPTHINNSSLTPQNGDSQNDLFGMEIEYNPTTVSSINGAFTTEKYYDGNISAVKWKTNTLQSGVTPSERIYGFDYDALSRLKYAYSAAKKSGIWNAEGGMFDEEVTNYDKHGNINGLKRYSKVQGTKTLIDNLTYDYYTSSGVKTDRIINMEDATGNKLGFQPAVSSANGEYSYDANGNLEFDHNKRISEVTYNHLIFLPWWNSPGTAGR